MGKRRAVKPCHNYQYNKTGEGEVIEYCRICKHSLRTDITSSANCVHFLCRNCYVVNGRACSQCTCEREQEIIRLKKVEEALKQAAADQEKESARKDKKLDEDSETNSRGVATNEANSSAKRDAINPNKTNSDSKMINASTSGRGQATDEEKSLKLQREPSVASTSIQLPVMTESGQSFSSQSKQSSCAENGRKSRETAADQKKNKKLPARKNKKLDEDLETKSHRIATNAANSSAKTDTFRENQTNSDNKRIKKESGSTSGRGQATNEEKVLKLQPDLLNSQPSVASTSTEMSAMTESSQCVTLQSTQFCVQNELLSLETGLPTSYADEMMESSVFSDEHVKHRRDKCVLKEIQHKLIIRIRITTKHGKKKYKIIKHRRRTKNHSEKKRKRSSKETACIPKNSKLEGEIQKAESDKTHKKSETTKEEIEMPKPKRFKTTKDERVMPKLERFDTPNVLPNQEGTKNSDNEKNDKGFAHYGTICVTVTDYKEKQINSHWEKIYKTESSDEVTGGNEKTNKKMHVNSKFIMSENFEVIKQTKGILTVPRKMEKGEPKYGTLTFHYAEVLDNVLQPSTDIVLKIQDYYLKMKNSEELKKVMLAEIENSKSVEGPATRIAKRNKNDVAKSGSIYKNYNLAMKMARIMSRLQHSTNGECFSYSDDDNLSHPVAVTMSHSHFCPHCNFQKQQALPASGGWIQPGLSLGPPPNFQTKPEIGQPQGTKENKFLSLHLLADVASWLQFAEKTSTQKIPEVKW